MRFDLLYLVNKTGCELCVNEQNKHLKNALVVLVVKDGYHAPVSV